MSEKDFIDKQILKIENSNKHGQRFTLTQVDQHIPCHEGMTVNCLVPFYQQLMLFSHTSEPLVQFLSLAFLGPYEKAVRESSLSPDIPIEPHMHNIIRVKARC